MIQPELKHLASGTPKAAQIIAEAEFGYRQMRPYLETLSPGASVLEVGSGPCILLAQIVSDFPLLSVTGIEPIGPGFDGFEATLTQIRAQYCFQLVNAGYEDFSANQSFDLIFSINVFEHLPDWRHFLRFVRARLRRGGKCVILCPNYGFPYESHFGLPIFINKAFTERLFRRRIAEFEGANGYQGLWSSLNFVSWREVRREAAREGIHIVFRSGILRQMIERLHTDTEFRERQRAIASVSEWMLRIGIVRLLEAPMFRFVLPYMFLEITP